MGKGGHTVSQGVALVHGVVDGTVVELHLDAAFLLGVVRPHHTYRVPQLELPAQGNETTGKAVDVSCRPSPRVLQHRKAQTTA